MKNKFQRETSRVCARAYCTARELDIFSAAAFCATARIYSRYSKTNITSEREREGRAEIRWSSFRNPARAHYPLHLGAFPLSPSFLIYKIDAYRVENSFFFPRSFLLFPINFYPTAKARAQHTHIHTLSLSLSPLFSTNVASSDDLFARSLPRLLVASLRNFDCSHSRRRRRRRFFLLLLLLFSLCIYKIRVCMRRPETFQKEEEMWVTRMPGSYFPSFLSRAILCTTTVLRSRPPYRAPSLYIRGAVSVYPSSSQFISRARPRLRMYLCREKFIFSPLNVYMTCRRESL